MRRLFCLSVSAIPLLLVVLAACAGSSPTTTPTTQVPTYPTLVAAQVANGQAIYVRSCASCHGAKAQGAPGWATPGSDGLHPAPAHDDSGHTWHHSDRVLYATVRDGMGDPLKPDAPLRMPAFKDKLSDAEIRAVIEYLKTFWSAEHRQWQFNETRKDFVPTTTPEIK